MPLLRTTTTRSPLLTLLLLCCRAYGWGSSSSSSTEIYGNSLSRDWLENSNAISLQLEGCFWGYVNDNEESGCMEDESEDGTTYWYQMANCRRAQAAFSLYAASSGNSASCGSSNFKESFVTTDGVGYFINYLKQYDASNPFGDNYNGDDDNNLYNGGFEDLPTCEGGDNGYVGLGCADDGSFALVYFSDEYCLQPTGNTYDSLNSFNKALKYYKSCAGIAYGNDGNQLPYYLVSMSQTCSSLDSGFCMDNSIMSNMRSHLGSSHLSLGSNFGGKSWMTKLKYVTGGLLLLASFVMFTGILFTNRRRRRALLQRKYRQSKSKKRRSKSRTKDRKSSSRSRSRARPRDESGVFA